MRPKKSQFNVFERIESVKRILTPVSLNKDRVKIRGLVMRCARYHVRLIKKLNKTETRAYDLLLKNNLNPENYGKADDVCRNLAKSPNVESIDVVTGDYEIIIKLRVKDSDEYYNFVQNAINKYGIAKTVSMTSLKQFKSEFVEF